MSNIVNNIDIDKLPDDVQEAIMEEFRELSVKHKLIVYSRFVHGHLFKVNANDLFNINKQLPTTVYRNFINNVINRLNGDDNENN